MFKNKKINKTSAIVCSIVLVLFVVTCAFAYQAMKTDDTVNAITAEKLNAKITETLDGENKKEISVVADDDNTGPLKVRVAIRACWKDATNNNLIIPEAVPDFTEHLNLGTANNQWTAITITEDNEGLYQSVYYVYNQELEPGEKTSNLLKTPIEMTGDNEKVLEITVLSQTASPAEFEKYLERGNT